jgi:hypothetical protein
MCPFQFEGGQCTAWLEAATEPVDWYGQIRIIDWIGRLFVADGHGIEEVGWQRACIDKFGLERSYLRPLQLAGWELARRSACPDSLPNRL